MKKIAVLPIRSGSKRIPRKNFYEICGIPLYAIVLAELVASNCFDKIIFSIETGEKVPLCLAKDPRVDLYFRSPENTKDNSPSEDFLNEIVAAFHLNQDDFLYLFQATNPFLRREYIEAATNTLALDASDSVISMVESKRFTISEISEQDFMRQTTQNRKPSQLETGLLWGTRVDVLIEKGSRIGWNPLIVKVQENDDFDIDTTVDLNFIKPYLELYLESTTDLHAVLSEWFSFEMKILIRQAETKRAMRSTFNKKTNKALFDVSEKIKTSLQTGGKIVFFGNGGSAADSQHIAAEFVSKLKTDRCPLSALALTTDSSAMTAIGNDYGFEFLFERQVLALVQSNDIVVGITTSGQSKNVLKGLSAARKMGAYTVMMTGANSPENDDVNITLRSASVDTATIQEIHIQMGHMICFLSEKDYV